MGWSVTFLRYNVDGDMTPALNRRINADSDQFAKNEGDWREGEPSCGPLRVLNRTFSSMGEFEEYCNTLSVDAHVAARVQDAKVSKADFDKVNAQLREHCKKVNQFVEENQVWHRTSEFIGCSGCGSKLSRVQLERLHTSTCPLCRVSLLSPTIQKRYKGYMEKREELEKKLEAIQTGTPSNRTVWVVRCAVHH